MAIIALTPSLIVSLIFFLFGCIIAALLGRLSRKGKLPFRFLMGLPVAALCSWICVASSFGHSVNYRFQPSVKLLYWALTWRPTTEVYTESPLREAYIMVAAAGLSFLFTYSSFLFLSRQIKLYEGKRT